MSEILREGGAVEMDELFTTDEIIKKLKISRTTLYRLLKKGLPHLKVGSDLRFVGSHVMKYLRDSQTRQIQQTLR